MSRVSMRPRGVVDAQGREHPDVALGDHLHLYGYEIAQMRRFYS